MQDTNSKRLSDYPINTEPDSDTLIPTLAKKTNGLYQNENTTVAGIRDRVIENIEVTKEAVGLDKVENLTPAEMPVSTATKTALDAKVDISSVDAAQSNNTIVKRDSGGKIFVASATNNGQAVNKAQMDAADALKADSTEVTRRYSFTPGSSSGQRRYIRLMTVDGQSSSGGGNAQFFLTGTGDYGGIARGTYLVHLAQRGSDNISVKAWGWNHDSTLDKVELYTKQLSPFIFELWARLADWNFIHELHMLGSKNITMNLDSITTTAPEDMSAQYTIIDYDTALTQQVSRTGDTMSGNLDILGGATTEFRVGNSGSTTSDYRQTFRAIRGSRVEWMWGRATSEEEFLNVSLNNGKNFWNNKTRDFIMRSTANDNILVATTAGNVGVGTVAPAQKLEVAGNARINGVDYIAGTGFPNGIVSAPVGSKYIDTVATNGAVEWTKLSGTGNTGWSVTTGDTGWRNITSLAPLIFKLTGADTGLFIRRINNLVMYTLKATAATTAELSFDVPQGFGTLDTVFEVALLRNPVKRGQVQVSSLFMWLPSSTLAIDDRVAGQVTAAVSSANQFTWPSTLPGTAA